MSCKCKIPEDSSALQCEHGIKLSGRLRDQKDMVEWEKEERFVRKNWKSIEEMIDFGNATKDFCIRLNTLLAETRKETIENKGKEIKKAEQAMAKEKNLNQISFYEGYIKGLKYDH